MTDKSIPKEFLLRTNNDIFKRISLEAKNDKRSINNMINVLLEEALKQRKK